MTIRNGVKADRADSLCFHVAERLPQPFERDVLVMSGAVFYGRGYYGLAEFFRKFVFPVKAPAAEAFRAAVFRPYTAEHIAPMKKIISGKVREIYEVSGKELVIVTTDRISAFDVILGSEIRDKGVVLNQLSLYWFHFTRNIIPNHILSDQLSDLPLCFSEAPAQYDRRTVLVRKLKMLPWEFVVRGYMFGQSQVPSR